jgi:F0F1-type ATP synthase membrane subunit b/b'
MPSVEERLASLEARMDRMDDLHALIVGLRGDMNRQFTEARAEFTDVRADMNRQFADARADMNRQFTETRAEFTEVRADMNRQFTEARADVNRQFTELRTDMNNRFEQVGFRSQALDVKVDRHFSWVVGIQVALMLAIIGAMAGAYYR